LARTNFPGLLQLSIPSFVELIIRDRWCGDERRYRPHPAQAEGESISSWFGFLKHGLSPELIDLLLFAEPDVSCDERTIGILGKDHKRKEFSPELRKIQETVQ